jgi:Holliday junction DNA helicase RuvA
VIEGLRGRLLEVAADHVVIEVAGLSLRVQAPVGVCAELGRLEIASADAAEVRLATHLIVREDNWQLFGFREVAQRDVFRVLIGITGIGPRLALSLLSHLSLSDLVAAVESNDQLRFQAVPGIGKRTAARIAVELAGKLSAVPGVVGLPREAGGGAGVGPGGAAADAAAALVALGLAPSEAAGLVRAVGSCAEAPRTTAGILSAALARRAAQR